MEVIIYSNKDHPHKDTLLKKMSWASNLKYVLALDFKSLFRLVKLKVSDQVIIVFLISSVEDLDSLIANKESLFNSKYILILPNEEERLLSKAFLLYPRYLSHTSYGFKDVIQVLEKMIKNNKANP